MVRSLLPGNVGVAPNAGKVGHLGIGIGVGNPLGKRSVDVVPNFVPYVNAHSSRVSRVVEVFRQLQPPVTEDVA